MAGQEGEQLIFPLGQVDGLAAPEDLVAVGVDGQVTGHRHSGRGGGGGGSGHGGAADIGAHPGDELPHGKGLCDIVIGADLQAQHLVGFFLPGGEDDDRHIAALAPQGFADIKAVHFRQHHIQQDQVRVGGNSLGKAAFAVVGLQGPIALPLEVEAQNVHDIFFVLDDQNSFLGVHGDPPLCF